MGSEPLQISCRSIVVCLFVCLFVYSKTEIRKMFVIITNHISVRACVRPCVSCHYITGYSIPEKYTYDSLYLYIYVRVTPGVTVPGTGTYIYKYNES